MFGWVNFREEGKKKWKIGEKMGGKGVWMRRGGGEKVVGPSHFLSGPTTIQSLQNGREKEEECYGAKLPFSLP